MEIKSQEEILRIVIKKCNMCVSEFERRMTSDPGSAFCDIYEEKIFDLRRVLHVFLNKYEDLELIIDEALSQIKKIRSSCAKR